MIVKPSTPLSTTNLTGLPLTTGVTGTLPTANGGTNLTSFTSGGVVYASSSSALATGSALVFDGTNLGIGTSSPSYKLQVVKPSAGITARFTDGDGITDVYGYGLEITRSVAYIKGSSALHLGSAAGYSAAVLDASGNLGLGVTPSANSISKSLDLVNGAGLFGFDNGTYLTSNAYYNSAWKYKATATATLYYTNSGQHIWQTAASGTADTNISFTTAMTLNANGALALQGASTSANGIGITFPATQSASSNANTLDDYEEGTWTAAFNVTSGSITISTSYNTGRYTKVGRLVTVNLHARFSSVSSPSGGLTISGLPFTSDADAQCRNSGTCAALAVTSLATPMTAYVNNNSTSMTLSGFVAATGGYADAGTYINASSELYITLTYYV